MKKDKRIEWRRVFIPIIAYVIVMSVFENLNTNGSLENYRVCVAGGLLVLLGLYTFQNQKQGTYRFTPTEPLQWKKMLFLLPMVMISTVNLWHGVALRSAPMETALYMLSMICIGFIEELLFRGYLLQYLQKYAAKRAVLICGLTFGMGHIVNLINGADLYSTILQIIYAVAIGYMLSVFVEETGHILPCCVFHATFNALSAFANEAVITKISEAILCAVVTTLAIGYGVYVYKFCNKECFQCNQA